MSLQVTQKVFSLVGQAGLVLQLSSQKVIWSTSKHFESLLNVVGLTTANPQMDSCRVALTCPNGSQKANIIFVSFLCGNKTDEVFFFCFCPDLGLEADSGKCSQVHHCP